MKIELAVYTAQEGYSWQPGTVVTNERLREYKVRIGKFPSPDDHEFPIGGIFLIDDELVCYRYHVAKKIDFRGRDALYCVLGVVPKSEAESIDPVALLALPQFAAPMIPFPTSAELPPASPEKVPEWLKNLEGVTLDVRITGAAEKPTFAVSRVELPKPASLVTSAESSGTVEKSSSATSSSTTAASARLVKPETTTPASSSLSKYTKILENRQLELALLALLGVLLLCLSLGLWLMLRSPRVNPSDSERIREMMFEQPAPVIELSDVDALEVPIDAFGTNQVEIVEQ